MVRAKGLLYTLVLMLPVGAVADFRVEGHEKGFAIDTIDPILGASLGAYLLDGFFVRFGPPLGNESDTDHHLKSVGIEPGHPNAVTMTTTYRDDDADDPFAYVGSYHVRFASGILDGRLDRTLCGGGKSGCKLPIPRPSRDHVFVLRGFNFEFAFVEDAHVERLVIRETNGELMIVFDGDEAEWLGAGHENPPFLVTLDYSYLPPQLVEGKGTVQGSSKGSDRAQVPAGASVISGFAFEFTNGHHHTREIGVMTPDDGRVEVFWNDRKGDDPFSWIVDWAIIGSGVVVDPTPGG